MRVLLLSWEYPPLVVGGLGRHVYALATELAAQGHDVTVVSRHAAGAGYDELVDGVRVLRAAEDPPNLPMNDLLAWSMALNHALLRAVLRADLPCPDVIHAHDWLVAHAAATLKEHYRAPLVATVHATEAGRHQGWLPTPLNRSIHTIEWWLTYEARRVLTCSNYMRWEVTRLFDLPPGKVDVVPNGTDQRAFRARRAAVQAARTRFMALPSAEARLVVFSGRLEWEKGVHVLLPAFARVHRRRPTIRLVLAGTGTLAAQLLALARRHRLGRSVTFAGQLATSDLAALLGAADVAVVPSLYEPFGLVALEAAVAGAPLVASDTGGLRELVVHGRTGLLVPPDDPSALSRAMEALLDDRMTAHRMAHAARAAAAGLTWTAAATATAEVYARAIIDERALQASALRPAPPRLVVRDGNLLVDGQS